MELKIRRASSTSETIPRSPFLDNFLLADHPAPIAGSVCFPAVAHISLSLRV